MRIPPLLLAGFQAVGLVGLCGCASVDQGRVVDRNVPSSDVAKIDAWMDAEKVAGRGEGRTTVIGAGDSMKPIYGEGTVLVLAKISYDDLKAGMQVAYMSASGNRVVHVLKEQDQRGWVVQGFNNETEDRSRVTRYNLIGIVYASFATDADLK